MHKIKLFWNYICSIFIKVLKSNKMKANKSTLFKVLFDKPKTFDTGLRGTFSGRLYVDKKVFYGRKDVQKVIDEIRNSSSVQKQIEESKASAV